VASNKLTWGNGKIGNFPGKLMAYFLGKVVAYFPGK